MIMKSVNMQNVLDIGNLHNSILFFRVKYTNILLLNHFREFFSKVRSDYKVYTKEKMLKEEMKDKVMEMIQVESKDQILPMFR